MESGAIGGEGMLPPTAEDVEDSMFLIGNASKRLLLMDEQAPL